MRPTIAQLEAFFWTSQLGSVGKAARHLHLAQPTVSLRLRDLEAVLGYPLFEREGRGLRISAEGRLLLPRAASVLDEVDRIAQHSVGSQVSGRLRVGFAEGLAMICLPDLLERVRAEHPALRPEFVIGTSSSLEAELANRTLDLAVLVNPVGHDGVRLMPLGIQPTRWVVPAHWDIAPTVRPADLWRLPIVSNPPPSAMYRQVKDWFASAGLEPQRLDLCSSVAVTAHLVRSGKAIGILPEKMVADAVREGQVRVLAAVPEVENGKVYVCYADGPRMLAADAMIRAVQQVVIAHRHLLVDDGDLSARGDPADLIRASE
jgi:DNA-binding transcriptional LysR family regulator